MILDRASSSLALSAQLNTNSAPSKGRWWRLVLGHPPGRGKLSVGIGAGF